MVRNIVTRIYGGLGNQLFQYAAGKNLAAYFGAQHWLDISFFAPSERRSFALDQLNTSYDRLIQKELSASLIHAAYQPVVLSPKPPYFSRSLKSTLSGFPNNPDSLDRLSSFRYLFLDGYFQSYSHLQGMKEVLTLEFTPKHPVSTQCRSLLREIKQSAGRSVCLHIRRGDYVLDSDASRVHGTCDIHYYAKAIEVIGSKIPSPKFFIFSDDIEWCKDAFSSLCFSKQFAPEASGRLECEDMFLMSLCAHYIIANSTYSWWPAFLSDSPGKMVVAPAQWFKQAPSGAASPVLPSWIQL